MVPDSQLSCSPTLHSLLWLSHPLPLMAPLPSSLMAPPPSTPSYGSPPSTPSYGSPTLHSLLWLPHPPLPLMAPHPPLPLMAPPPSTPSYGSPPSTPSYGSPTLHSLLWLPHPPLPLMAPHPPLPLYMLLQQWWGTPFRLLLYTWTATKPWRWFGIQTDSMVTAVQGTAATCLTVVVPCHHHYGPNSTTSLSIAHR